MTRTGPQCNVDVLPRNPRSSRLRRLKERVLRLESLVLLLALLLVGSAAGWTLHGKDAPETALATSPTTLRETAAAKEAPAVAGQEPVQEGADRLPVEHPAPQEAAKNETATEEKAVPAAAAVAPVACANQSVGSAQASAESAATTSAREAAGVDPRDSLGQAVVAWRAARRLLALAASGSQEFYSATVAVNENQRWVIDLEVERRAAELRSTIHPQDAVGIANANYQAATWRLEALEAPLPAAEPLYDFGPVAVAGDLADSCS